MIKKRLVSLLADAKKQIAWNVFWQWVGLMASILMMGTAGRLLACAADMLADSGEHMDRELLVSAVVILAAVAVRLVCARRATRASFLAGRDVRSRLRCLLYQKLTRLGASYHEKVPTAEAVQVAVEGVEQLEVYFGKYLPQLIYSVLAPVTLFVALAPISVRAGAVLLLCVPLIPLTIVAVQRIAKRLLGRYWGVYTELGDSFLENLQGLTTLKIYQADGQKAQEMDREAEKFRRITMKVLMMQLNSIIVMDVVAYGGAAVGMMVALGEFFAGRIGIGGAVTVILLSAEFFLPMRLLGSYFHIAMNGMAASDQLFAILDIPEEAKGTGALPDGPLGVEFSHVDFAYEGDRMILRDISLRIPERGMVSLVGVSGCGKSTVAAVAAGSRTGYRGSVRIGGMELGGIAEESLLSHVTLVGSYSYLFKGTVEENLRLAAPEASEAELIAALKKVNLYDFLVTQKGLATELTERGSNLSGGQCQRLALARALLHDTPVYIFDEATSNIDVESENQIMEVIHELACDHAVLFVSHRLANVVGSDRIYVLHQGQIAGEGTHAELIEKGGRYAALYREQRALEEYGLDPVEAEKEEMGTAQTDDGLVEMKAVQTEEKGVMRDA